MIVKASKNNMRLAKRAATFGHIKLWYRFTFPNGKSSKALLTLRSGKVIAVAPFYKDGNKFGLRKRKLLLGKLNDKG